MHWEFLSDRKNESSPSILGGYREEEGEEESTMALKAARDPRPCWVKGFVQ